jgi:hypothetical protein
MTAPEILEQISHLAAMERLEIAESVLHQLRSEMKDPISAEVDTSLARAARDLLPAYSEKGELTAFTALDAEPFNA